MRDTLRIDMMRTCVGCLKVLPGITMEQSLLPWKDVPDNVRDHIAFGA